jgi:hypothetical protein
MDERIRAAAGYHVGVLVGLKRSLRDLGEAPIASFFAIIPERGVDLWKMFTEYQRQKGWQKDFKDFVLAVTSQK